MSSRYEELERLQRLRESGALTDEEFQLEKRRLLGHASGDEATAPETPAPEELAAEESVVVAEEAPSRRPLYLVLGGIGVAIAIVAGLLLGRMGGGSGGADNGSYASEAPAERNGAMENMVAPPAPFDVRALPPAEQLSLAVAAAFPGPGGTTQQVESGSGSVSETITYKPGRLIWASFGPILVSEGVVDEAAHASAGKIAVHYLRPEGNGFAVVRAFPAAVVAGSSGHVGRWSVGARFSNWPVIAAQGGGTWQGYTCSNLILTELRPEGPAQLATVPLSYDDSGAKEAESEATTIEGKIINIVRNQSFDVVYSGDRAFSEHYVRTAGGGYAPAGGGKSGMKTC
jgi:hypothetical protein